MSVRPNQKMVHLPLTKLPSHCLKYLRRGRATSQLTSLYLRCFITGKDYSSIIITEWLWRVPSDSSVDVCQEQALPETPQYNIITILKHNTILLHALHLVLQNKSLGFSFIPCQVASESRLYCDDPPQQTIRRESSLYLQHLLRI